MSEIKREISFEHGVCTEICLDFIDFVRSLGQKFGGSDIYRLRYICRQMNLDSNGVPKLSKDTAIALAQKTDGEAQGTQLNRIRILRKLAEYMVSAGFEAYIIPKNFTQKYKYDFRPYIFDRSQISAVYTTADNLGYSPRAPHAHLVIPAIIRVLFGCGLRSSEARFIKAHNVDLDSGILYIEKSKLNISRFVPMAESLTSYLCEYSVKMGFRQTADEYFFPTPSGGPYHETSFRDRFKAILSSAQIPMLSDGRLPRVHDARHSFVVHSFARLTREYGLDLYTALPILATYVGHTNLNDTERYIHLPTFDYQSIIEAGAPILDSCVPEVIFDA